MADKEYNIDYIIKIIGMLERSEKEMNKIVLM